MDKRFTVNPNAGITNEDDGQKAAKIKVRYAETKMVKDMRENFEKREKIAQRSSKTYRLVAYSVFLQGRNDFDSKLSSTTAPIFY